MKPNILNESPMSMVEVKAELEKIETREKELTFRSQRTKDYIAQFSILDIKKAEELYAALKEIEIPRLRDVHFKKLVDILPTTAEEVKVVLQGYTITVKEENLKKIAETVSGFVL